MLYQTVQEIAAFKLDEVTNSSDTVGNQLDIHIFRRLNPLPPRDADRQKQNFILKDLFSSILTQLKKYHPSET